MSVIIHCQKIKTIIPLFCFILQTLVGLVGGQACTPQYTIGATPNIGAVYDLVDESVAPFNINIYEKYINVLMPSDGPASTDANSYYWPFKIGCPILTQTSHSKWQVDVNFDTVLCGTDPILIILT